MPVPVAHALLSAAGGGWRGRQRGVVEGGSDGGGGGESLHCMCTSVSRVQSTTAWHACGSVPSLHRVLVYRMAKYTMQLRRCQLMGLNTIGTGASVQIYKEGSLWMLLCNCLCQGLNGCHALDYLAG